MREWTVNKIAGARVRGLFFAARRMRLICYVGITLVSWWGTANGLADELFLRGEDSARQGTALQVNDGGVYFRKGSVAGEWYSWDRVRDLQTGRDELMKSFANHRLFAEDIWRARERVEREDYARAEPIFEAWFGKVSGRTDPSALVVAEGLLRCRLARGGGGGGGAGRGWGGREGAVLPWLETWRIKQAGVETPAYRMMEPVMDTNSGLCPALAPVWIDGPALNAMVMELGLYIPVDAPVVEAVSRLYLQSAQRVLHMVPDPALDGTTDISGGAGDALVRDVAAHSTSVLFVKAFTDAVAPTASAADRTSAIKRLSTRVSDSGWKGAWAHFARGEARLHSKDEDEQKRGLVDLLYLPSEYVEIDWYLAGMALADSTRYLEEHGQSEAAAALRDDLTMRFADHPVMHERLTASANDH